MTRNKLRRYKMSAHSCSGAIHRAMNDTNIDFSSHDKRMRLFEQKVVRKGVYHSLFTSFSSRQEIHRAGGHYRCPAPRQLLIAATEIAGHPFAVGAQTPDAEPTIAA
ncbi:hypothetical protein [Candidatus Pantoea floridensis]|uniref:hypothetical protein n=1 Tax=Candidatus Pantoea floridensis TaxID=1938870 RepID=UPI000C4C7D06|nr:hypothetical protein [Pantoea floridensis]PIF14756.1 hypothetical protein BX596_3856 [Enterobacteriaceae bacterium JKS000233]